MNRRIHPFWFWLAATNAVYLLMVVYTVPQLHRFSDGLTLPDLLAGGYDAGYVRAFFGSLGSEGTAFYFKIHMVADMVYPALFGWTYGRAAGLLAADVGRKGLRRAFILLPCAAAAVDYAENLCLMAAAAAYPDSLPLASAAAPFLTVAKSLLGMLTFAVLAALLLWRLFRRRKA